MEEITLEIIINPEDFDNTTVPALLVWDPYSLNIETGAYGIWKHAAESCNEDITRPIITGTVFTVKICPSTFLSVNRKRSTTATLTSSYQMTLTSMNISYYNSAPEIKTSIIETYEDIDVTSFQLQYEDYEWDDVVLTIIEGPMTGTASLSADGLLNYTCAPDYFGEDYLRVSATDNSRFSATVVKNITIKIKAMNDLPQFGLYYNETMYDVSINKSFTLIFEGNDTEHDLFDLGFADVDANDTLSILESITNKADVNITLIEKQNITFMDQLFMKFNTRTRKEYTAEMTINRSFYGHFQYYVLGFDSEIFYTERLEVNMYILWSPCVNGICAQKHNNSPHCSNIIRATTFDPYICKCWPGYIGTWCEKEANECFEDPCGLLYDCTDKINEFECTIKPGPVVGILLGCAACVILLTGLLRYLKKRNKKYSMADLSPLDGEFDFRGENDIILVDIRHLEPCISSSTTVFKTERQTLKKVTQVEPRWKIGTLMKQQIKKMLEVNTNEYDMEPKAYCDEFLDPPTEGKVVFLQEEKPDWETFDNRGFLLNKRIDFGSDASAKERQNQSKSAWIPDPMRKSSTASDVKLKKMASTAFDERQDYRGCGGISNSQNVLPCRENTRVPTYGNSVQEQEPTEDVDRNTISTPHEFDDDMIKM